MNSTKLIQLRIRQLFRFMRLTGFGYLLLIAFLTMGVWLQTLASFQNLDPTQAFLFGIVFIILVHINRKDLFFLRAFSRDSVQFKWLLFLEYLSLLMVPGVLFLIFGNSLAALAILVPAFLGGVLPHKGAPDLTPKFQINLWFLPKEAFEIRSGIRRFGKFLLPLYMLAFGSFYHIAFFIIPALLISSIIMGFYDDLEGSPLIKWDSSFLERKAWKHTLVLQGLFMPLYGMALFFQPTYWLLIVLVFLVLEILVLFSICYKYARYRPGVDRLYNGTFMAIYFGLLILPGGVLVCLVQLGFYWRKAKQNMKSYYA